MLILCIVLVAHFILSNDDGDAVGTFREILGASLIIFIVIGSLLSFLDFITQGYFKRNRWIAVIYFPIYRVFSLITFSFLYRPLVYNFLDNRFGKRLLWILIPAYGFIIFLASLEYQKSNFIRIDQFSSETHASYRNYENEIPEEGELVRLASIPSKVIDLPYLNLFIVHSESLENYLTTMNKGLKPEQDLRGLRSNIVDGNNSSFLDRTRLDSLRKEYLKTFEHNYIIKIDSLTMPATFVVSSNKRKQLGFETYLNIKNLAEGKHLLRIKRKIIRKGDTLTSTRLTIPFWYFK
jgi:hypothetical protein